MKEKKIKQKKEKINYKYMNMKLDSYEEQLFLYWVEELIQTGLISKVERSKSYTLTDGIINSYVIEKILKTKTKIIAKSETILQPSIYTPDFNVYFTSLGIEKFCWSIMSKCKNNKTFINDLLSLINGITTIEIKGNFNIANGTRIFNNNKKFLYNKHMIFTNLVIPDQLFEKTFLPEKAKYTYTGKLRKVDYKYKTLKEFLNVTNN